MHHIYLDTSYYINVLLGEIEFQFDKNIRLCTSLLTFFETERTLIRLAREKHINTREYSSLMSSMNHDMQKFIIKVLDFDILNIKQFPLVRTPKTADSIHLKTALWFKNNDNLDLFLTLDGSQADSALELGLQIKSK